MKNFTFLILFMFVGFIASSQLVTITEANQIPVVDDTISYYNLNDFGFDPAGTGTVMDKTWDFSAQALDDSLSFWYVDPATTALTDSFTTSTIAEMATGVSGYIYFATGSDYMARKGMDDGAMYMNYYGDSARLFEFPITAGDSYTCDYVGTIIDYGTMTVLDVINGSVDGDAVAQGQLITPWGTFDDVLCIQVVETFSAQIDIGIGTPMTVMNVTDDYLYWFHEDHKAPIFISGTTVVEDLLGGGTETTEVLRCQPITTGPVISDETDFLTFMLPEQAGAADINTTDHTISIEVVNGTSLTALTPIFTLSAGANADIGGTAQTSGVTTNDYSAAVIYTVTAEDGTTTQDWTVTVTEAALASDETDFTMFMFAEQTGPATIDDVAHTIDIEVSSGTNLSTLTAIFTLSAGATADIGGSPQTSGVTVNNFTGVVTYTVTAEDGTTTQDWQVTVTEESSGINDNNTNTFNVYPNPAKDRIFVKGANIESIVIYDVLGNVIYNKTVNSNSETIMLDYPAGVYVMKAKVNGETKTLKVILE